MRRTQPFAVKIQKDSNTSVTCVFDFFLAIWSSGYGRLYATVKELQDLKICYLFYSYLPIITFPQYSKLKFKT